MKENGSYHVPERQAQPDEEAILEQAFSHGFYDDGWLEDAYESAQTGDYDEGDDWGESNPIEQNADSED